MFYPVATAADHPCICEPLSVVWSDLYANTQSHMPEDDLFYLIETGMWDNSDANLQWYPHCPDTTAAGTTTESASAECTGVYFWNEIRCQC